VIVKAPLTMEQLCRAGLDGQLMIRGVELGPHTHKRYPVTDAERRFTAAVLLELAHAIEVGQLPGDRPFDVALTLRQLVARETP